MAGVSNSMDAVHVADCQSMLFSKVKSLGSSYAWSCTVHKTTHQQCMQNILFPNLSDETRYIYIVGKRRGGGQRVRKQRHICNSNKSITQNVYKYSSLIIVNQSKQRSQRKRNNYNHKTNSPPPIFFKIIIKKSNSTA